MTIHAPPLTALDWRQSNAAFLDAALDWIAARAEGSDGALERIRVDTLRSDLCAAGMPTAIDGFVDRFGLSDFDADILLLALAPDLDGGIAARFAALTGGAGGLTLGLVAKLLFGSDRLPLEALARLGPEAPLIRHALLAFDEINGGPLITAALRAPAAVRSRLCGEDVDPAALLGGRALPLVPLPDRLVRLADAVASAGHNLAVALVGAPHSGREAVAAAVAALLGRGAWRVGEPPPPLPVLRRELTLADVVAVLSQRVDGLAGPFVITVETPPADGLAFVRLPPLTAKERGAMWQASRPRLTAAEAMALGEQFVIGPSAIAGLDPNADCWAAARQVAAPRLEGLAMRIVPARGLDEMVLAATTRAQLVELAAQARQRVLVLGDWGYRRLMGAATGCAVLFAGPSGVGKTMAAEAVALELGVDLWVVDLAQVTSKYIGETEKNLRTLFDAAEACGALLFFDEADALFGKRSEVKDAHDRYANQEVSYLLQRMERYPGVAILATNLKGNLDTAFLRRLRMMIDFPVPDAAARADLWRRALPPEMPQADIDIARLARLDLAGGPIITIASNAAFAAAARGSPLTMADLMSAAEAEFRKLDRDLGELGPG